MREFYTYAAVVMTSGKLCTHADVRTTTQVTLDIGSTESRYWVQARIVLSDETYHVLTSLAMPLRVVLARNGMPLDGYYSLKVGHVISLERKDRETLQLLLDARQQAAVV